MGEPLRHHNANLDLEDRDHEVAEAEPELEESCTRAVLQRGGKVGSVSLWCNQVQWRNARNRRECQTLSEAIDALVEEGLGEESPGLEIISRRLVGVQLADRTSDWNVCDAVTGPSMVDSVLPRHMFAKALRDAASLRRLSAPANRFTRYKPTRSASHSHSLPHSDGRRPPHGQGGARGQ